MLVDRFGFHGPPHRCVAQGRRLLGMVQCRVHKEPLLLAAGGRLGCVDSLPSPQGLWGSDLMLGWGNAELG